MSFVETLDNLALKKSELVNRFEHLIAPKSDREFEAMAQTSRALTLQNFGRTMRLFAPLYLSNECINNCRYCGFSRDNPILRVTLDKDEVIAEAQHLARQGFRQILLVAGEHPKFVSRDYLAECVRAIAPDFSSIFFDDRPRTGAIGLRVADYFPAARHRAQHARACTAAGLPLVNRGNDDERRQPHRARRLYPARPRTFASHCTRTHRRARIPGWRRPNRYRPI